MFLSRNKKKISEFLSENFQFLVLKFSIYFNRRGLVMSLIRTFTVCYKNHRILHECMNGEQRTASYLAQAQDDLNLRIFACSGGHFSLDVVHISAVAPLRFVRETS